MSAQSSVERLEERIVLSTFMVGNLDDSGPESLRQAILDANDRPGADLIRFAPAARDGAITLTSGQLDITDDLILDGPGINRLTLSGNDATRVFNVSYPSRDTARSIIPRPIEKSAMSQGVVQTRSRLFTFTVAPSGCVWTLSATI